MRRGLVCQGTSAVPQHPSQSQFCLGLRYKGRSSGWVGCQEDKPQLRARILWVGDGLWCCALYLGLCSVTCLEKVLASACGHSRLPLLTVREPDLVRGSAFLRLCLTSPYTSGDHFGSHCLFLNSAQICPEYLCCACHTSSIKTVCPHLCGMLCVFVASLHL